ncbi:MAG: class I SAM-dependent methyltransferase [Planctomycetota bacterium]
MSVAVELGPVQETLLIPLLGRAEETTRRGGLVDDPKAVEIVAQLDYDFDKWRGGPSMRVSSLRTRMFDENVTAFLEEYPEGTVVEIGCGLNTRFDRVDNGRVRWFDVDLPDVIALRRRFFEDRERCKILEGSVLDTDWHDAVAAIGGPCCFISEAVIIYLEKVDARAAITGIAQRFPGAWLLTDTTPQRFIDNQGTHDAMRHLGQESWCRWACNDPAELETWGAGLHLVESRSLFDASPQLLARIPWYYRVMGWLPQFMTSRVREYRLNRYVVEPSTDDGG